jgi:hypothetical protein
VFGTMNSNTLLFNKDAPRDRWSAAPEIRSTPRLRKTRLMKLGDLGIGMGQYDRNARLRRNLWSVNVKSVATHSLHM